MKFSSWIVLAAICYGGYVIFSKEKGFELNNFTCALSNEGIPLELIDTQLKLPEKNRNFLKGTVNCTKNMQCRINFQPWEKILFPYPKMELPFSKDEFYGGPGSDIIAIVSPSSSTMRIRAFKYVSSTNMKFGLENCGSRYSEVDVYPNLYGTFEKLAGLLETIAPMFKK